MKKLLSLILTFSLLLTALPLDLTLAEELGQDTTEEVVLLDESGEDAVSSEEAEDKEDVTVEETEKSADPAPVTDENQEKDVTPVIEEKSGDKEGSAEEENKPEESQVKEAEPESVAVLPAEEEKPAQESSETGESAAEVQSEEPAAAPAENQDQGISEQPVSEQEKTADEAAGNAASSETEQEEVPELPEEELVSKGNPPDKVENLKVSASQPKEVTLSWSAASGADGPADGYEVSWGTENDISKVTGVISKITTTTQKVTGLECGKTYDYFVRAYYENSDHNPRDWSFPVSLSYRTSPAAPTGFSFKLADNSGIKLDFEWTKASGDASGYYIYRVENGTEVKPGTKVNKNVGATQKYTIGSFVQADELVYRIHSYLVVNGEEVESQDYAESTYDYKNSIPAVKDLIVESAGDNSIKISWTALEGATKYVVVRYDNEYKKVSEQTDVTYTDTGLIFGMDYTYYVTAWVKDYEGKQSAGVLGRATGASPKNIKVTNDPETNSNKITWNAVDQASGYELDYSTNYNSSKPDTATWNGPVDVGKVVSYVDGPFALTDLGKQYSYRVRSYKEIDGNKVKTPWSVVVSTVVKPRKPVNLKLVNTDYKTQDLTWDDLGTGIKYEVSISTDSSFSDVTVKKVSGAAFTNTSCKNGVIYYYRVRAYVINGTTEVYGPYSETVSRTCAPAKPTVNTSYTPGVNQVKLTWAQVPGATHYRISYKENDGDWVKKKDVKASSSTQTYTLTDLVVGSVYQFGVSALRTADDITAVGQRGTTGSVDLDVKDYIPQNLKVTVISRTSVKLTWDEVNGITEYAVSGMCTELSDYKLDQEIVETNSITIENLEPGYTYKFTVQSKISVNAVPKFSDPSAERDAVPTSLPPSTLKVSASTKKYGFNLSWTKSEGASGYIVERSEAADTGWVALATIKSPDTLKYSDQMDKTKAGKTYFYRVRSYIDHGGEKKSKPTAAQKGVVKIPQPVIKLEPLDQTSIDVQVTNNTDVQASWYNVYRKAEGDNSYTLLAKNVTTLPYTDTKVVFGTVYYYRIQGIVKNGSLETNGLLSDPAQGEGKLTAVQNVKAAIIHGGSVYVTWKKLAGATGYNIYYKEDGGSWKLFDTVGSKTLKKLVTGLTPKTKYEFRVAGIAQFSDKVITGKYSASDSAVTKMEQTVNLKVLPSTYTKIKATWDKVKDATDYQIRVKDPVSGTWVKSYRSTSNSVILSGLKKNKKYIIKVRAYIDRNEVSEYGAYSSEVAGWTAPAKPTGLEASAIKKKSALIKWNKSTGADGYELRYVKVGSTGWTTIKLAGTTSQFITGLTANTKYKVQVRAYGNEDSEMRPGVWTTSIIFTTAK